MRGHLADRAAFFSSLPAHELLPVELALREALMNWLQSKPGPLPIIEWIESRIGGEIEARRDDRGFYELSLRGSGAGPAEFSGGLSEAEGALRDSIFSFLAAWRSQQLATLADLVRDAAVQRCRAALSRDEPLQLKEWITRRLGGELELRKEPQGLVLHLRPAAQKEVARFASSMHGKGQPGIQPMRKREATTREASREVRDLRTLSKEEFYGSLPTDELLPAELSLRAALLDFLGKWPQNRPDHRPPGCLPQLADAGQDPAVQRCKLALLPGKLNLSDWIEARIGGEVELSNAGNGQFDIVLRGQGPLPKLDGSEELRKRTSQADGFLATLPQDELTETEQQLRMAVLDFLQGRGEVLLTEMVIAFQSTSALSRAQTACLPPKVSLQSWINSRIGGEVEISKDPTGRFMVMLRGTGSDAAGGAVSTAAGDGSKDEFFATLPTGSFTADEEMLRDALLAFLDSTGAEPSPLSAAAMDPTIAKCRKAVLPRGCNVSLREWIDRRMGEDLEVALGPGGAQWVLGLPGTLSSAKRPRISGPGSVSRR